MEPIDVRAASDADPDVGLRAVRSLRVLAERLEALQVENARALGWSWQEIADRLGVSRQAAWERFTRGRRAAVVKASDQPG